MRNQRHDIDIDHIHTQEKQARAERRLLSYVYDAKERAHVKRDRDDHAQRITNQMLSGRGQ